MLELLGSGAEPGKLGRVAGRTRTRCGLGVTAVMAPEPHTAVKHERDVAVRAANRHTTGAAVQRGRDTTPVQEKDRLAAAIGDPAELGEERRRERVPGLAAKVDDAGPAATRP